MDSIPGGGDILSASTVKVLLERAPETSFGICIVGGQVIIIQFEIKTPTHTN